MIMCSGPFKRVAYAAILTCVAHGARDTESASAFASLESEVKGSGKTSSSAVVNVGAKGRLIMPHMLQRASATRGPTQSEAIEPALSGEPGERVQEGGVEFESPSAGDTVAEGTITESELSVQELLEATPRQCENAKVKARDRMMTSLGIGKTDYQMQLNGLSATCKKVTTQQKEAKKTMDNIAKLSDKLQDAEAEYQDLLIRLDQDQRAIKEQGELIEKLDAAVEKGKARQ